MRRPLALLAVAAIAVGSTPAHAATKKKKPDWKGSYTVTVNPDPTLEVLGLRGDGCQNILPNGVDKRPFTVPAAGKLTITLDGQDLSQGHGLSDWDFFLMAPDGTAEISGDGTSSNEQGTATFKKKGTYELQACNMTGGPSATISWVFKYA